MQRRSRSFRNWRRPRLREQHERTGSIRPAGVVATACRQRRPDATREAPNGDRGRDQPATRERQAGPYGVAERFVVPVKPGNSGGGKGPQLKGNARSDEGHGALTMSLATPGYCSGVADGVPRNIVSLFREPDAGNLPVRFDEREQKQNQAKPDCGGAAKAKPHIHRETTVTAPVLDSTLYFTH